MKALITAICVLLLTVAVICTYGIYSSCVTSKLEDFAMSDNVYSADAAEDIYAYWTKHKPLIHMGVNTIFTDDVTLGLLDLRAAIASGDTDDILDAVEALRFHIKELREINRVSAENIL